MIDTLKKTFLAGLGAAITSAERVQEGLDELVKDGKITGSEARAVAERIASEGKREFQKASTSVSEKVRNALSHNDTELRRRITQLEARIAHLETVKAVRPRPVARAAKAHASGRRK